MGAWSDAELPPVVEPMLATPGPVPEGPGWSCEIKWDGVRALIACAGDRWRVRSRSGREISASFPELAVLPDLLDGRRVTLDAELVVLDPAGVPDFPRVMRRVGVTRPGERLLRQLPAIAYVFDVLYLDGEPLTGLAYRRRRDLLDGLALQGPGVCTPPYFLDAAAEVYAVAADRGFEGVVCKRLDSLYQPGHRSKEWRKTVIPHLVDVVVCGWLPGRGRLRDTIGALLLGAYDAAGRLRYVGRVGSGLTSVQRQQLRSRLAPLRRATAPLHAEAAAMADATWVEPRLVAQVAYRTWTQPSMHLRHPVFRALHEDRDASAAQLPESLS